jgi:hypothetical protein
MRPFSTDVPMRSPIRRRGTLISKQTAQLYIANVHGASAGNSAAIWEGTESLVMGSEVTLEFDPTIPAWWIMSP